jgi:hypothetical protein
MKSYFEQLESTYPEIYQELLLESPHTRFLDVPPEFEFIQNSIVDFGFENLNLDESSYKRIMLGFSHKGVSIPGTSYKVRATSGLKSVIEPMSLSERLELPELPENWKESLLVLSLDTDQVRYAGGLVRADQLPRN